jgi:FkbM family methyltransferase
MPDSVSLIKTSIKNALGRLGYTIQRFPTPASDPQFALAVDFEFVLAHYLASRQDPRPFFFLEVGANDGILGDPLYRHALAGNWHGILVEPQPSAFAQLLDNYAGREGLTFVNAAISGEPGTRTLYVIQDDAGETITPFVASFREEPVGYLHHKLAIPGSRVGSIEVTCETFAELLSDVTYLDLLQIDVEGYDLEVLRLFDFDRLTPPIVRFEHRNLSAIETDEAVELLARHGYRVVREEYDMTAYAPP